ncbi:hypothetical protein [Teredinibacter turnerae]|uniref:hypothetical protein n=1 Tax=Teredinibacter turnerae TaxID=2426 RepID=UPI00041F71E9|nr:hypothetical protein [Teredinibacter turnerae]
MNTFKYFPFGIACLFLAANVAAHEQEDMANTAEKPDCKKMAAMDHSKMKMDDPVMQAMMKQCAEAAKGQHNHAQHGTEKKKMEHMHHDHQKMMESKSAEKTKKSDKHDEHNH